MMYDYPPEWRTFTGEPPMDTGLLELTELVRAIRNRCDIYMLACDNPEAHRLLPTLLEDLYDDAQTIIDEYCIERNDD